MQIYLVKINTTIFFLCIINFFLFIIENLTLTSTQETSSKLDFCSSIFVIIYPEIRVSALITFSLIRIVSSSTLLNCKKILFLSRVKCLC